MIELHSLTPTKGHARIMIEDTDPAKRAKLAKQITEIIRLGHSVFVETDTGTFRVSGYDKDKNEWIVKKPRGRAKTIAASGTKATAVPPRAGG